MAIDQVPFGAPGASETVTTTGAAVAFTSGTYIQNSVQATKAVFFVTGGPARFTSDGTTVGIATGQFVSASGDPVTLDSAAAVANFSAVAVASATGASIYVTYSR